MREGLNTAGTLSIIGILWLSPGCTTNDVFAWEFDACMDGIRSLERGPQHTVLPFGREPYDYCFQIAQERARRSVL